MMMSRKNAFLIHFSLSFLIVSTCIAIVFLVWYPGFYFYVFSAASVLKVLISVDLIVGPLLTLFLYKPGKPGLYFDLCVIGVIQLSALVYGMNVAYTERPIATVFAVDRFEVLTQQDVDLSSVDPLLLEQTGWLEPVLLVARLPEDLMERNRLVEETVFEGKPDLERRPEYWHAYTAARQDVLARARPLQELQTDNPALLEQILQLQLASPDSQLVYLPIMGRQEVFSLVLDASSGYPVGLVNLDPWAVPQTANVEY